MPNPLSTLGLGVAGALQGGGAAEQSNVQMQQRALVEDNFKMAEQQRNMQMVLGMRQITANMVQPQVDQILSGQNLVRPGQTPADGQKVASPDDLMKAYAAAYEANGISSADENVKAAAAIQSRQDWVAGLITGKTIQAQGEVNRGLGAAQEVTRRDLQLADQKYSNMDAAQAQTTLRSPNFLTLPPAEQQVIQQKANSAPTLNNAPGLLNAPPAPASGPTQPAAPASQLDTLFPVQQ